MSHPSVYHHTPMTSQPLVNFNQYLEDDPISTSFKGSNREKHKHLCPEQGKWLAETSGGESWSVQCGAAHAQHEHSSENPAAPETAPAQLLVRVRTQPPSVLLLKDMGVPSPPYRTHGGACTLCAPTATALTTRVLTLLLNIPPSEWHRNLAS